MWTEISSDEPSVCNTNRRKRLQGGVVYEHRIAAEALGLANQTRTSAVRRVAHGGIGAAKPCQVASIAPLQPHSESRGFSDGGALLQGCWHNAQPTLAPLLRVFHGTSDRRPHSQHARGNYEPSWILATQAFALYYSVYYFPKFLSGFTSGFPLIQVFFSSLLNIPIFGLMKLCCLSTGLPCFESLWNAGISSPREISNIPNEERRLLYPAPQAL